MDRTHAFRDLPLLELRFEAEPELSAAKSRGLIRDTAITSRLSPSPKARRCSRT
ncbi:hypothetical protein APR12_006886, partial [Nocardia amikacinitolerans]|nr:hypothetical protein [Nocardia amikacinitolerans]